ncbi:bromodomain-containing protein 7 isoform X2 [Chelonus insularis]|nr:bromodomain-containing protein 7 isoform X2 [Chelonus insularis]XP_034942524.1 bromodomain-containing protein 7 isoform X2 [Chelonus insularis]
MLSHQQYQQQLGHNYLVTQESEYEKYVSGHKKLKKKKKKKDKRHKHHHKEKKRRREESSQESIGDADESLLEGHKKVLNHHSNLHHNHLHSVSVKLSSTENKSSNNSVSNNGSSLSPHREPRSCVLKKIAEKSPLQRLLEHLLRSMEKRDPQQFFAWPVTDNIAPGYSQIITNPMDFSTIKQKIDENTYQSLNDFIGDFKLMCDNAMIYNHSDTIYYKAAKKLLHVGLKMVTPEKIRQLRSVLTYIHDITKDELGFELGFEDPNNPDVLMSEEQFEKEREQEDQNEEAEEIKKENERKLQLANLGKFEAIPDDLTPEEILKQARGAAKSASDKLSMKRLNSKMGFLRQKKDGTTSLQIIVHGDGVIPGTNQRPVSLGQLIGKLSHGTGNLAGFREDRRNMSKPVKSLYYGAFGSYAPSYDSTFSNLTKEETELVYQTYGDETAVQYAESILDFAKDCDYTLTLVDDLLDILTNGDHKKTKKILEEKKKLREEEESIKNLLEKPTQQFCNNNKSIQLDRIKVDVDQLKTLTELGINTNFLDDLEKEIILNEERGLIQNRLDDTSQMLERLRQVQHERLSVPPPAHLSAVLKASDNEANLAGKITENITEIAKKLPPSAIAPIDGLRRAMGIAPVGGPEPMEVDPITHNPTIVTDNNFINQSNLNQSLPASNLILNMSAIQTNIINNQSSDQLNQPTICLVNSVQPPMQIQIGLPHNQTTTALLSAPETSGVNDLESELREFLESDPTLGHSPLHDDKTLEDILSES